MESGKGETLLAIGLIIFAPIFIRILYGTEYQTAAPVLRLLALTMIANGAKEVSYGILSSQGSPLSIMKNLVIGIILSAILNYFIIPQFGVIGCSVVTVLVTFTTAFLLQINITRITELSMKDFYTLPSREDVMSIFLFKKK